VHVAVADIGTNSTRLLIADVGGGVVTELARESEVTRLGDAVDATGRLADDAQARVLAVLERYAAAIAAHRCEASVAVMTSAVRDAANGAEFAATLQERTGLEGRTLSGDEEAAYTYAGATATRSDAAELVVIDIGGGSTELVCGARGELGFHTSTQIGVVRHSERHLHGDPPSRAELDALAAAVDAELPTGIRADAAIAVAGTPTSCAAIDLGLERYDRARIEGHVLSVATLEAQLERLAALPLAERRAVRGLHPDRAPTIVAGVVILLRALAAFGLDRVEVSDRDILWGVALDLAKRASSIG
jgi:exopolyphosphatase/guanosine-5'-triphosphate,3'-diphosphate pyrophosphatase